MEEQPLKLDGEVAYASRSRRTARRIRRVECVVAYHGGKLIAVIIGGSKEMVGVHAEIEEVVGT